MISSCNLLSSSIHSFFSLRNNPLSILRLLQNVFSLFKPFGFAKYSWILLHNLFPRFNFTTCLGNINFLFSSMSCSSIHFESNNICMQCSKCLSLPYDCLFGFFVSLLALLFFFPTLIIDNKVEFWQDFCLALLPKGQPFCGHKVFKIFVIYQYFYW